MPVFNDSENRPQFVPAGDYLLRVVAVEKKISNGMKTAGDALWALEFAIEQPVQGRCWDNLIDNHECHWKWDVFLKSMGVTLAKGEGFEFDEEQALYRGVRHIPLLGLRGWVLLGVEDNTRGGKRNRVVTYYTDKPKLPRVMPPPSREEDPFVAEDENVPF
jgi:hypothetical protein